MRIELTIYTAVVCAAVIGFLHWNDAAQGSPHPISEEPKIENHLYATPLKLWRVEQQATDRTHVACSATRAYGNVTATIAAYQDGARLLSLSGVSFGIEASDLYADVVVTLDNETHVQTTAKYISRFETSIDFGVVDLTQVARSKIMRLTVNNFYVEFDLTGSANAAKYVSLCNAEGPANVLKRRVSAALPAVVQ